MSKNITIDTYNKTASAYHNTVKNFNLLPELNEFMHLLDPNSKILDLGCGPGHHSKLFKHKGFEVVGVDLSIEMIKIARREVKGVDFKVMDILNLDFEEMTFDAVWASASLLHVPKENMNSVLQNIHSILKNNGYLYLSLKEGEGENTIQDSRYDGLVKFYSYYNVNEIESFLLNSRFEILNLKVVSKREFYDTNSWLHIFCRKE